MQQVGPPPQQHLGWGREETVALWAGHKALPCWIPVVLLALAPSPPYQDMASLSTLAG